MTDRNLLRAQLLIEAADLLDKSNDTSHINNSALKKLKAKKRELSKKIHTDGIEDMIANCKNQYSFKELEKLGFFDGID